jgi:hypothetical protein
MIYVNILVVENMKHDQPNIMAGRLALLLHILEVIC